MGLVRRITEVGNVNVYSLSSSSIDTVVVSGEPRTTLEPIGLKLARNNSVASTMLSSTISTVISALFELGRNTTVLVVGTPKSATASAVCASS